MNLQQFFPNWGHHFQYILIIESLLEQEFTSDLEGFQTIDTVGSSLKLAAIGDTIDKMPLRVRVSALDETTANIDATKDASNNIWMLHQP